MIYDDMDRKLPFIKRRKVKINIDTARVLQAPPRAEECYCRDLKKEARELAL
jgi:hypothetical protein